MIFFITVRFPYFLHFQKILKESHFHQPYYFFEQNGSLTNAQHGFTMSMSTESVVCKLIVLIVRNLDKIN